MASPLPSPASDNGLSLGRHAFMLFVSVVFSVAAHFALMYYFGHVSVAAPSQAARQAHITPENLPPMHVEAFVQRTELVQAEILREPDTAAAVEQSAQDLPAQAETAKIPEPTLPTAPKPAEAVASAALLPPPTVAELPAIPDSLLRQAVASVPENDFTRETNPDPLWTIDAAIPTITDAPDLASSVETENAHAGPPQMVLPPLAAGTLSELSRQLGTGSANTLPTVTLPTETVAAVGLTEETALNQLADLATAEAIQAAHPELAPQEFRAIDDRLNLALTAYETPSDPTNRYFRLDILRRPESPLPIMPKDVVFIQDISGSIGYKRLQHSKDAMRAALFNTLRAGDRFNIFAFRDVTLTPSSTWLNFNPETRQRAETFIDSLRARGNTDLFLLLQDLLSLPIDPKRPLIAVVVTDGEATVGVTETTRIIGEFSRMNGGRISVYTFGAKKRDPYFLDMLCYTNRGENTSASGRASSIAAELTPVFESIRNPVMKDLALTFDNTSGGEVHPRHLTNLYADRMLTLYGRVPKATRNVTCQLRGVSAEAPYDAVFTFSFAEAKRTRTDLRKAWAERAMFDLLAEYAENPSRALLARIAEFSRTYQVTNPYRK